MAIFQFTPVANSPFAFQPTFDGQVYTCLVTWNAYAQRWYVTIYTLEGLVIATIPLIGSASVPISITAGYFTSTMVYHEAVSTIEVLP
jgi:hypothetical protein